jgi:hypothetical protein
MCRSRAARRRSNRESRRESFCAAICSVTPQRANAGSSMLLRRKNTDRVAKRLLIGSVSTGVSRSQWARNQLNQPTSLLPSTVPRSSAGGLCWTQLGLAPNSEARLAPLCADAIEVSRGIWPAGPRPAPRPEVRTLKPGQGEDAVWAGHGAAGSPLQDIKTIGAKRVPPPPTRLPASIGRWTCG